MSFILDALRKSESERQVQSAPGISDVPYSTREKSSPLWMWALSALLVVNVAVLAGILFRSDSTPAPDVTVRQEAAPIPAEQVPPAAPAAMPDQAGTDPAPQPVAEPTLSPPPAVAAVTATPEPVEAKPVQAMPPPRVERRPVQSGLKSFNDLRAAGVLHIGDLHLDIHVYSEHLNERFVFINMTKYKENATIDEGPVIREITPEGVVLEHTGTRFLLPRE